jgi:hypothetical protein
MTVGHHGREGERKNHAGQAEETCQPIKNPQPGGALEVRLHPQVTRALQTDQSPTTAAAIAARNGPAINSVFWVGPAPTRTMTKSSEGMTQHRLVL